MSLVTFLILSVFGSASVVLAGLLILVIIYFGYKAARLLIALLNAAITEPEIKIVGKVRKLSKSIKPKGWKPANIEPPRPWPRKKK
jgi:hypothetical protein